MHNNANIMQIFMEHVKRSDTENFMKSILFCFGAPTIRGLKAACLINFRRNNGEDMRSLWRKNASRWLDSLGVEWLLLNEQSEGTNALVMIYRRELLMRALGCYKACDILRSQGYPLHNLDECLKCLREKFLSGVRCPHEVGLFLDYPPDDVKCFMESKPAKNLYPGYWKVYSNVKKARRTFRKYKRAEYDVIAFGSPAMGAEVLEEAEMEPFFSEAANSLSGKKVAVFGSYDWGDGEWLRTWEERCKEAGAVLVAEGLKVNLTPDDAGVQECKAWGAKLA